VLPLKPTENHSHQGVFESLLHNRRSRPKGCAWCSCGHTDIRRFFRVSPPIDGGALQRRVNISNRPQPALYHPKSQEVMYFFDHIRILYKRNYSRSRRTFRRQEWIIFPPKNGEQTPILCINRASFFLTSTTTMCHY